MLSPWKESSDKPRSRAYKKQRHYFSNKGLWRQSYDFSISHVWMWMLDHKEDWVPKNWCFQTVVLKTLENPWTARSSNQSILKEFNPWIFIGRTDAEDEVPNTLATWCEELTHWKRPWCWEWLKTKGEGGSRGWVG